MGRPPRSPMDLMRTQLWLAEMLRVTGSANINQLGDLIDDVDIKKTLYKYAAAKNGISKEKLIEIDERIKRRRPDHIDGKSFFHIGPQSDKSTKGFAPLWDALDGSIEKVSEALIALDPAIGIQKYQGVSFRTRCAYLIYPIFKELDPPPYWENLAQPNHVADGYGKGEIEVDIELITFAIGAWRMANFIGELQPMMNYILIGLLDRAIPETLDRLYKIERETQDKSEPDTITKKLLCKLKAISLKDIEDAEDAIKDLNYYTPAHPIGGQIHDYRFLINQVKRASVAEYLAGCIDCGEDGTGCD